MNIRGTLTVILAFSALGIITASASAKEVSIREEVAGIGINTSAPEIDGDGRKNII